MGVRPRLALVGVLALVAALGARRLDREIAFYDEAVYVASARSLAVGAGYRNPNLPGSPPQAKYPPGVSLLLSAVWRVDPTFPDNLPWMKGLVLLAALATLAVAWAWLRGAQTVPAVDAVAVTALVGLGPLFLVFGTAATSDVPYALLSLGAIWLYERTDRPPMLPVLALATLAFLTRTTGLMLFAALVAHLLVRRRIGAAAATAAVATAVVLAWLAWTAHADAAYAGYPPGVRGNYVGYASGIPAMTSRVELSRIVAVNLRLLLGAWGFFVFPWAPLRISMVVAPLAVAVLVAVTRPRRPSLAALYCGLYVASILLVPYPDTARYALPIVPLLLAWTVGGLRACAGSRPLGGCVLAALLVAAVGTDAGRALRRRPATADPELHAAMSWIAANLPPDAILVGAWDAGYHLFTGRRAIRVSVIDNPRTYYADAAPTEFPEARELADAFQRMGACYFVHDTVMGGIEAVYFERLMDAVEAAAPGPFETVYASAQYAIHRRTGCVDPSPSVIKEPTRARAEPPSRAASRGSDPGRPRSGSS